MEVAGIHVVETFCSFFFLFFSNGWSVFNCEMCDETATAIAFFHIWLVVVADTDESLQ